jgi:acetate kinase
MGITPLEGLVMGTRSGDIDPALALYIMRKSGMSVDEMDTALNKKAGLLGITGKYSDRRDIENAAAEGDKRSELAQEMEAYRLRKYIGAYYAALGCNVDALIFTAGVGEFGNDLRAKFCQDLDRMGFVLDAEKNKLSRTRNTESYISADKSPIPIMVIPTDEELVMTEDAVALMEGRYDVHTKFQYSFAKKDYVNKTRAAGLEKDLAKNPALKKIIAVPK